MPTLPEYEKERDFELVDKAGLDRGTLGGSKPVIRKYRLMFPKKLVLSLSTLVLFLVVIYLGVSYLYPMLTKKKVEATTTVAKPFEYPLEVNAIKYPSEVLQQKFLENMQNAAKETDLVKRYKFVEDGFLLLKTFYTSAPTYDLRVQLDKYKQYMQKNYPEKAETNRVLYDYPCMDKQCTGGETPAQIKTISGEIAKSTVMNAGVKESISRNFDAASFSKDKSFKLNVYMGVLSMLVMEYKRTNDVGIKTICADLSNYITQSYPKVKIPKELQI